MNKQHNPSTPVNLQANNHSMTYHDQPTGDYTQDRQAGYTVERIFADLNS